MEPVPQRGIPLSEIAIGTFALMIAFVVLAMALSMALTYGAWLPFVLLTLGTVGALQQEARRQLRELHPRKQKPIGK